MFYDEEAVDDVWFLDYFRNIFQLQKLYNRHGQVVACEMRMTFEPLIWPMARGKSIKQ
jgi:hypothetical protein